MSRLQRVLDRFSESRIVRSRDGPQTYPSVSRRVQVEVRGCTQSAPGPVSELALESTAARWVKSSGTVTFIRDQPDTGGRRGGVTQAARPGLGAVAMVILSCCDVCLRPPC